MIVITALALAWLCLFFFQIGISIFLFYTYYLDKDKRKLIFGMGFLISSYAHIYQAISLESIGNEIAIFTTLYYWSVLPLLFSISSAVHESLLPFKFERRIDIIYFLSVVISLLLIIGLPFPERITYVFIASLFTIELLLATLYVIIKNRRLTDVYFFISVVLLGIGGISLGGMFEQPFSLLALSLGFLFIGIAFYSSKEKEIDSPSKISHYFTLRKQLDNAKKALNETEEKYRHIALSTSDLIAMLSFSIHPKYTYVSPSHKRIMGYDEKDLLGKNALSFVHPDDKLNLLPILRNYLAHKTKKVYKNSSEKPEETLEFRIRDKNGNWHYLESKANIAGNQILLISRDITKRKNTELELLKTKAFLEASINQSSAGILIADAPDVNIRYANPAALGIRGGKKKNLTEISLKEHVNQWQTYYPDGTVYKPEDLPLSRAILKGEIVNDEEVIIRNTDGVDRYVLANAAPVKNECGEIIAGVVVFSDITELKKSLDKERIYQQNLIELNKNAFNMLKKSTLDEMYTYIGNTLTEIIDDAIIIIGNYNEKQNQVTVKNLFGVKQNRLQKLLQILKVNPIGKTYELREDIKDLYSEQKIVEIKGGLQGLSKNMYSSFAIKKIEHLLNLKKIYTIGLRRQNQLFAWIHIFKFNQPELKNKELVEAFLSQSSLILQRKFYEEKNKDLANIVTQSDDAIIQTDLSFEIIYINPKAEELYGYTSREVIGKTPELFNAEPAAPELQKKIYDTVSKG